MIKKLFFILLFLNSFFINFSTPTSQQRLLKELSMVEIKGGYFFFGGYKTKNSELKYVPGFYICNHKVTNREYRELLEWCKKNKKMDEYNFLQINFKIKDESAKKYGVDEDFLKMYFNSSKYDNYPVVCTTYSQKLKYLELQSLKTGDQHRLPHDYEFEFLALEVENPNDGSDFKIIQNKSFDERIKKKCKNYNPLQYFNLSDPNKINSHKKKSNNYTSYDNYKPNLYNIYDLVGNVFEQCSDVYDKREKVKIIKGGAFYSDYELLKIENKTPVNIKDNRFDVGFRCVIVFYNN